VLAELAEQVADAGLLSAAALGMSRIVAGYVDQTSEEIVAAYTRERESWLRNRNTARAARIRKAEESLGRPVAQNRHDVELARRASHWLGPTVLRPASVSWPSREAR
jgi:hypothetical protein